MQQFVEALNVQHPIIQAPMAGGATTPELVAAVSNAGGLGSLGAGYMHADDVKLAIDRIRTLTDKPFAVNLFVPEPYHVTTLDMQRACRDIQGACAPLNLKIEPVAKPFSQSFEAQINVLLKEKISLFSFTFGLLDAHWIAKFKSAGTLLMGTATTLAEAEMLAASGVDMIVAQGAEAGGHRGTFLGGAEQALMPRTMLLSQLVKQVKLPIIAAGGIMHGKEIAMALEQGAVAAQLGTAFLSCPESGIHANYKKALLAQKKDNTTLTRAFSGKLARGIRNQFITQMEANQSHLLDYPVQNALTRAMRQKAKTLGNIDYMSLWAGQSVALSRGLAVDELISQLLTETASN